MQLLQHFSFYQSSICSPSQDRQQTFAIIIGIFVLLIIVTIGALLSRRLSRKKSPYTLVLLLTSILSAPLIAFFFVFVLYPWCS